MFNKEELIGLVLIQPFQWMLRARLKKVINSNPAYDRAKPVTYSTQYVFSIQAYLCYGGSAFAYTYVLITLCIQHIVRAVNLFFLTWDTITNRKLTSCW